jgi:hypothetical protein
MTARRYLYIRTLDPIGGGDPFGDLYYSAATKKCFTPEYIEDRLDDHLDLVTAEVEAANEGPDPIVFHFNNMPIRPNWKADLTEALLTL